MATLNGLPVFKIFINENLDNKEGIDFISLVDHPAIEVNWVAMSANQPIKINFNQDQKLLYGPILIPDLPIYRNDPVNGEYYVVFTKEEIQTIVRKFQKQNKNLNLNYQHQPNSKIDAVVQEIWLTGANDKSKDFGFNIPVGSAFAVTYVEDNTFWNEQVKTGNVKGYSIEGWLDMKMAEIKKFNQKYKMEAKTSDGLTLKTPAETFAVGADATITNADGTEAPAEGEYTLDNGMVVKCMGGKVTEVTDAQAAAADLTPEEVAALSKMFASVLKPLTDKIEALELKFTNMPGAKAATSSTDQTTKKPTAAQSAYNKIIELKSKAKK